MERFMEIKNGDNGVENKDQEALEEKESSANEVAGEVLGNIGKETGEVFDAGGETLKTTEKLDGDDPERKRIEGETQEIKDEVIKSGDEAREGVDEIAESESEKRIRDWDETDDNKKKEEIESYEEILRVKLEKDNLLAEGESIEDQIEELKKRTEEFAKKKAAMAMKVQEQCADAEKMEGIEQGEAREMIKDLARNAKDNLNIGRLKWFSQFEADNFGDLMNEHKVREVTMENLEEMADDLENLENFLAK